MLGIIYKYSDKELEELLKSLTILVDSREQQNQWITDYFDKKKINYMTCKLDAGDYSAMIPKNEQLGVMRNMYLPVMVEKKNSVDELASSFKDRARFEAEFVRAKGSGTKIYLLVEDGQGYANILNGNYRSEYNPKALLGSLKAFESRYNFTTAFIDKKISGNYLYYTLLYSAREFLKS